MLVSEDDSTQVFNTQTVFIENHRSKKLHFTLELVTLFTQELGLYTSSSNTVSYVALVNIFVFKMHVE